MMLLKDNKKRGIEKKFTLVGIISLAIILMAIAGLVFAQTQQELEQELSQLEQELFDRGYSWLVNYNGTDLYSEIEVYEKGKNELIAKFSEIFEDKKYRVILEELNGTQDTFDLKIQGVNGGVEFDYVVDPGVSTCDTLSVANSIYTLTANVTSANTCFNITANNITLDGRGFSIKYGTGTTNSVYGVHVRGANFTKIKNFFLINAINNVGTGRAGIRFDNAVNGTVFNNTIYANSTSSNGISLSVSHYTNISSNFINTSGTSGDALVLSLSDNNTVINNNISTKAASNDAIVITGARGNFILFNRISVAGTGNGIFGSSSTNDSFLVGNNITMVSTGLGIALSASNMRNNISSNMINTSSGDGIVLSVNSLDNNISYNNITTWGNGADGILLTNTRNNTIIGNIIFVNGTSSNGIILTTSNNTYILANNITSLGSGVGISLSSQSLFNNIISNTINTSSSGAGIFLSVGWNTTVLFNNITTHLSGHAIYLSNYNYSNISNNFVFTNGTGAGIYLYTSSYNRFYSNFILTKGSGDGINLENPVLDNNIYDSTFNASAGGNDVEFASTAGTTGILNLTNVSRLNNGLVFAGATVDPMANVKWWLDAYANYTNGSVAGNVNITLMNVSGGGLIFSELTGSNGRITKREVLDYMQNATGIVMYYNNHTINATSADGGENFTRSINISTNRDEWFQFDGVNLTSCKVLKVANMVYYLSNDVSAGATCFEITRNNVTLDCNRYNITFGTAAAGYGVYSNKANFTTVRNCEIVEGSFSGSAKYGVYYLDSNNGTVNNNSVYGNKGNVVIYFDSSSDYLTASNNYVSSVSGATTVTGIEVSGGNGTKIINNSVFGGIGTDQGKSISLDSGLFHATVENNTFNSSGAIAVMSIQSTFYSTIKDNRIKLNRTGGGYGAIRFGGDTNNNSFHNNIIEAGYYLINGSNDAKMDNFSMVDSVLNSSGGYAEISLGLGVWNFTNITVNGGSVNISGAANNATVNYMWWVDALALYTNESAAVNVNVSAVDVYNNLKLSALTGTDGRITRQTLLEFNISTTGVRTYYSNYTFNASLAGFDTISRSINISTSRFETFYFNFYPKIDFIAPTPVNGFSTTNTSIEINVSILETELRDVRYNWNGTNYTIYNDSLVLYLNMNNYSALGDNETHVKDISNYGNNGTCMQISQTPSADISKVSACNQTLGKWGLGIRFNGKNETLNVSDKSSLDIESSFSLAAWINVADLPISNNVDGIIGKGTNGTTGGYNYNYLLAIRRDSGPVNPKLSLIFGDGYDVNYSFSYSLNRWYHVAGVFDDSANTLTLYQDGIQVGQSTGITGTPATNAFNVMIGGATMTSDGPSGYGPDYFNGTIDEVMIWNRSLSVVEIEQLYKSSLYKINRTDWVLYVNQTKNTTAGLGIGNYTYYVFVNDTFNGYNQTETRSVTITAGDTTPPIVTINFPANVTYGGGNLPFNFNVSLNENGSVMYSLNGGRDNKTMLFSADHVSVFGNVFNYTNSSIADGSYVFEVYANDTAGNRNYTANITFSVKGVVTGCGSLSTANTVYTLVNNVSSAGTCFSITANNITLEGRSHNVSYAKSRVGYGINNTGNRTKINNLTILQSNITFNNAYAIYLTRSRNVTISNNTIYTNGNQSSYGIYLDNSNLSVIEYNNISTNGSRGLSYGLYLLTSSENIVRYNLISTNGLAIVGAATNNHGLYLITSAIRNNITNNSIFIDGSSNDNYGIKLQSNVNLNIFDNNTIRTNGTSSDHGIYFNGGSDNIVKRNNITTFGSSSFGVYLISGTANTVDNNNIFTSGASGGDGVYIGTAANNITNNNITGFGTSGSVDGIEFLTGTTTATIVENNSILVKGSSTVIGVRLATSSNIIRNNNISTIGASGANNYGVFLSASNLNIISLNTITTNGTSGAHGIRISLSHVNNITDNNISARGTTTANHGISIEDRSGTNNISLNRIEVVSSSSDNINFDAVTTSFPNNNTLVANTLINVSRYQINFQDAAINGTVLVDQIVFNYTFTGIGSLITIRDTAFGEVNFIKPINGTSNNLSNDVIIRNNSVKLNLTNNVNLNRTANISLYGIGDRGFTNIAILVDSTTVCDTTTNPSCYNFTSLTADNVIFNVSSWIVNYSIGNGAADTTPPNVTINFPANVTYGGADLPFNFNVSLNENGSVMYSLNGGRDNKTMLFSADHVSVFGNVFNYTNSSIADGSYVFEVYANDTAGNRNYTANITFSVKGVVTGCGDLNISNTVYTLINNVSSAGTCFNVRANNVSLNCQKYSINYSQTSSGYGINISGYDNSTIKNCNVRFSGSTGISDYYGVYLLGSNSSLIFNNNISTRGGRLRGYGIYTIYSKNNNISSNAISTNGNPGAGDNSWAYGIFLNEGSYTIIENNNNISTDSTSSGENNYGIYLSGVGSIGNNISYNVIYTNGFAEDHGIFQDSSSSNTIMIGNNITTRGSGGGINYGVYLSTSSNNTIIGGNVSTSGANSHGFYFIDNSDFNRVINVTLSTSGTTSHGFYFDSVGANNPENNNLTANVLQGTTGNDLGFADAGINNTRLIDQAISDYAFTGVGGIIIVENTTFGGIRFLTAVNGSGNRLLGNSSADIKIENNSATVQFSVNIGLNRTANVTFYGMGDRGFSNPTVLYNNLNSCDTTTTPSCYNFTSLTVSTVMFNVSSWSNYSIGNGSAAPSNIAPTDPTPDINSTRGTNRTSENLHCFDTLIDPDGGRLNVSVDWFNKTTLHVAIDYNNSYANNTFFESTLGHLNTTNGENWTCGMRLFDGTDYSARANTSYSVNITALDVPTLSSPGHASNTTDRTPNFTWSANTDDATSDITYQLNVTLIAASTCSEASRHISSISGTSHEVASELMCFIDNGDYYNWSVRLTDTRETSSWSSFFSINISTEITLAMINATVQFGNKNNSQTDDTSDDDPPPLVIRNDGNAFINVTINASNLWNTQSNPSSYYQFKIANYSPENGSFYWAGSVTTYTNMPAGASPLFAIALLNHTNATDSAEIDINITVPADEPFGTKRSYIAFTGTFSGVG